MNRPDWIDEANRNVMAMVERDRGKIQAVEEPNTEHEHTFIFLRQETRPTKQWGDRVNERLVDDVFFCSICLMYKRVVVRHEEPDPRSFGWREVV